MKKSIALICLFLGLGILNAQADTYNVKDFGAVGDGIHIDSEAINQAIQTAAAQGGGTVHIPAGEYACYSIRLASHIHLHLEQGATIVGACLSATNAENQQIAKQTPSFTPKNVKSGVFVLFKIIQPLHNKRVAILKESDEKRLIFIYPFTLIFQDFTSS